MSRQNVGLIYVIQADLRRIWELEIHLREGVHECAVHLAKSLLMHVWMELHVLCTWD